MIRNLILYLILLVLLNSCNYVLLIPKGNVIKEKIGFVLFTNQNDYFLPYNIKLTDSFQNKFNTENLTQIGFLLSGFNRDKRWNLIEMYSDTLFIEDDFHKGISSKPNFLLPVKVRYIDKIETNKKIKSEQNKKNTYSLQFNGRIVEFRYNMKDHYFISVDPYLPKERRFFLENKYLEKYKK